MKTNVLRIVEASMLALGIGTLTSCFYGGRPYYGSPGYAHGPAYTAPYRDSPSYYPPVYSYEPEYRPAYRNDDGGRGWAGHEHEEHEEREEHEEHEHGGHHG